MSLCRTCLKSTTTNDLISLFDGGSLPHKIEVLSSVKITEESNLPSMVCTRCALNINLAYRFRLLVINTNFKLHNCNADDIAISQAFDEKQSIKVEHNKLELDHDQISLENSPILNNNALEEIEQTPTLDDISVDNMKFEIVRAKMPPPTRINLHRMYKCQKCDFQTTKYRQLYNHRNTVHRSVTSVVCSICGKWLLPHNMKKHTLSHYSLPVTCTICGRICKNAESMRSHMMYHREREIICHICGKVYRHSSKYAEHVRKHTNPTKEKTHQCQFCGKLFAIQETLRKHIRSHTGERPYPCEFCKKGFSSRNALNTHRRRHTKERPFVCSLCPMAFPQKVSLRTHLRSKHNVEDPKSKMDSIIPDGF